jgi:hypothetical protein
VCQTLITDRLFFKILIMKKFLIALVVLTTAIGCQKENGQSLIGTKWTYEFNSAPYVMEFMSATDVRTYETDSNYNYKSSLSEGKYTYNNGNITFKGNFGVVKGAMIILYYRYYFKSATINGDIMKAISSEEKIIFPIENGTVQEPEIEAMGDYTSTLMKLK